MERGRKTGTRNGEEGREERKINCTGQVHGGGREDQQRCVVGTSAAVAQGLWLPKEGTIEVRSSQRIGAIKKGILWSNGSWLGKEIGPA